MNLPVFTFYVAIRRFKIAKMTHICTLHCISIGQIWSRAFSSGARVTSIVLSYYLHFPHTQVFDVNAVPTLFSSLPSTRKVGFVLFVGSLFLGTIMDFASGLIFHLLGVGLVGVRQGFFVCFFP